MMDKTADDRGISIAMEQEANAFAMELLMPSEWLRSDVVALGGVDIDDYRSIHKLAKKYRVTDAVMTVRLGQMLVESTI